MNCRYCGAPVKDQEHLATGDWNITYACGTSHDDNGEWFRSKLCELNEAIRYGPVAGGPA
jgi:hypothetical protein